MFGLFKKNIHEPVDIQRQDIINNHPSYFAKEVLAGDDCDELPESYGGLGSLTNPIPVNGSLGEIKYLAKLRGLSGRALFFHRVSSCNSPVTSNSIDEYEVVCMDGTQWNKLYFDMYHPRRSNKAPKNYSLMLFEKSFGMDLPFAYGVNGFVENFPHSIPELLVKEYGESPGLSFARRAKENLNKFNFKKEREEQDYKEVLNQLSKFIVCLELHHKHVQSQSVSNVLTDKGLDFISEEDSQLIKPLANLKEQIETEIQVVEIALFYANKLVNLLKDHKGKHLKDTAIYMSIVHKMIRKIQIGLNDRIKIMSSTISEFDPILDEINEIIDFDTQNHKSDLIMSYKKELELATYLEKISNTILKYLINPFQNNKDMELISKSSDKIIKEELLGHRYMQGKFEDKKK